MIKILSKKIEKNRDSESSFWKFLSWSKDFAWWNLIGFRNHVPKNSAKVDNWHKSVFGKPDYHFKQVFAKANCRPEYVWGIIRAGDNAKLLGLDRISIIEFGVAFGHGLIEMERAVKLTEKIYDIKIDIYGFDSGKGMPKPKDYRDMPHLFNETDFLMDEEKLKSQLNKSRLILGPVKSTINEFIKSKPAPVGFVAFNLDYYSSTLDAFKLFLTNQNILMPRIFCYFQDILGPIFNEHVGENLAISDFNKKNKRKISKLIGIQIGTPFESLNQSLWNKQFYLANIFDHKLYNKKLYSQDDFFKMAKQTLRKIN
jgi:hypothetical protein